MTWKHIPNYKDRYLINERGDVYSLFSKRLLKPKIDKYGYLVIALSKNGKTRYFGVHRLVAITFIPNIENKPCVNHINEVKTDNRVCNLEWVTVKENDNHGTRNARMARSKKKKSVIQMDLSKNIIAIHDGIKDAQRNTGVNRNSIRDVCRGNRLTAGGFAWAYKED